MWWLKQLSACLMLLAVAACAGGPDARDTATHQIDPRLGQINIMTPTGRVEQIYKQKLEQLLARSPQGENRYTLTIRISTSYPTDAVEMRVDIDFYDQQEGRDVMNTSLRTSASVGAVASLFGSEEAKANARERLAASLAEKTYHRLFLFFRQTDGSDGS